MKKKLDDLEIDRLKTVPVDLKKLSDVGDNEVFKNKIQDPKNRSNNLEKKWFLMQLLKCT